MKNDFGNLKQTPTRELKTLLASGIRGESYKAVLAEYATRPGIRKKKITPAIGLTRKVRDLKGSLVIGIPSQLAEVQNIVDGDIMKILPRKNGFRLTKVEK